MDDYMEKQRTKFHKEMEPLKERLVDIIRTHSYGSLRFTMTPKENDIRLLETYPEQIKAWRDFMKKVYADTDDEGNWEESNFHDVCRGFMAALGVNVDDAYSISTLCRYNFQDFEHG